MRGIKIPLQDFALKCWGGGGGGGGEGGRICVTLRYQTSIISLVQLVIRQQGCRKWGGWAALATPLFPVSFTLSEQH